MRRLALIVLALLAVPAHAGAMEMDHAGPGAAVAIEFAAFAPPTTSVLAGDTVTWTNDASRAHTVTADDGSFDSGRLVGGTTFHTTFTQPGANSYYCRLHSFMRGEVDVYRLLLDAPSDRTTGPGRPFVFSGRSALAPGTDVAIEADSGGGFSAVGATTVLQDGTFKATVTPDTSATFRAVAGDDASQPVSLLVLDRTVTATASTKARRATVRALVAPASPGATVVLQFRLRERFGWWPVARAKVGRDGRATLVAPVGRKVPARVVLTLADGATQLARTPRFSVGR
jgi:plastocyanin